MKTPSILPVSEAEGKKWPQFLAATLASLAVFTTGLHTGWPAPSLPKLLSDEYPYDISNDEASYVTIIGHLGNLCGGLLGTTLLDKIGRKKTILAIAVPQLVSFLLIILSYQLMELLYIARFVGGVAEGMTFTIIPIYIAEIAEPSIRGTLGTLISVTCMFGIVYANVVGSYLSIKITATTFLVFPALFILLFWKMPESPYYLLMMNKQDEAEAALKFLRRKASVGQELTLLIKDVNRQMSESGTFKDIFTIDSNRKAFLLMIGTRVVQQWTGVSAFGLYIQLLLGEATDALSPQIGSTILLFIQLIMAVLSTFFVDKSGRKPLLLFSTGGCCLNLLIQAVYFGLKEHTTVDVSVLNWFPLVMMILFVVLFSTGLGVVVNILNSEIFSASIKAKCVCLVNIIFALGMMSTTKFYQATADAFGLTVPYASFGLISLGGCVFLYLFIPETKGKSLEEIQQQLKGRKSRSSMMVKA
ncbi:facilitated trehalose transporter Tret1-2 homolog [Zophobas morio]|uniref:facilitated trehalose transporter Tret1-2 homolog n=1 Tax=Zophobas morio TaxID=2755281 RepID=UPI00308273F4